MPEPDDDSDREWSGYQSKATADADYYALHFAGHVSTTTTNRLLNRFQSASKVIRWAQRKPKSLLAMHGIGERTVEKLADLDKSVIQTPEERGHRPTKKAKKPRPEGDGLAAFTDDDTDDDEPHP